MKEGTRRRLLKRKFYKDFLYYDENTKFEFYLSQNEFGDLSILIYDLNGNSFKEFFLDFATFREVWNFTKGVDLSPLERFTSKYESDAIVEELIEDDYVLVRFDEGSMFTTAVVAKLAEFDKFDDIMLLKRMARAGGKLLGVDSMALPTSAAKELVEKAKELFKGVDIEVELEIEEEENAND